MQIKKELTITCSDVDKMRNKELIALFYSCIFTRDEMAPKNLCKILLTRELSTRVVLRVNFVMAEAKETIKL
jgi:hypothetical protein